ncbi:MAG: tRNA (adenosine(37)-N6)-threonylcarbamoyltransferase complex transferase subunit TsaD [Actinobacteria bacterium]|nr:tRNA (adenosine(37)-N6)-threonylcarbamoyltransferase complex transferase subunit TsaD [Actinomycetota bacterium]
MSNIVLGIETSCDETAAAVLRGPAELLSNVIASQIPLHQKFGGVVPEIASRKHLELVLPVVRQALDEAGVALEDIDCVAVTSGPGLVGALLVGVSAAKAIVFARDLPLVGVNHLRGHIYANFLSNPELEFPMICLVVSGGHTDLIHLEGHDSMALLGRTRDDAAGEAFDKVARALGLGYPGGPLIDRLAREGNPKAVDLPRAFLEEGSCDFSFSGLKTAAVNFMEKNRERVSLADVAAGFQAAVAGVLVEKTLRAAAERGVGRVILAGGVAANSALRSTFDRRARERGVRVSYPPPEFCTDNAAMIACAGYYAWRRGDLAGLDLNAVANLALE